MTGDSTSSKRNAEEGEKIMNSNSNTEQKKTIPVKLIIIILAVIAIVVILFTLPIKDYMQQGLEWTESLGVWGPVFVALFYIVACILFLPGSIITLGAGALFGLVTGLITVSIGSVLGASAAFLVGRTLARKSIESKVSGNARFSAIDEAVGKQGFKIVFLTRLSPIFPFNLLNYAFGLTKVGFWQYLFASWIGMLPGTIMYVYLGSAAGSLANAAAGNVEKTTGQQVLFWVGLAATVVVATYVTKVARKALAEATEESKKNSAGNDTGAAGNKEGISNV
jgi:uncharacterized membrane protein YdjX (TVP38/TMEM64 family)